MGRIDETPGSVSSEIDSLREERAALLKDVTLPSTVKALQKEESRLKISIETSESLLKAELKKGKAKHVEESNEASAALKSTLQGLMEGILQHKEEANGLREEITALSIKKERLGRELTDVIKEILTRNKVSKEYISLQHSQLIKEGSKAKAREQILLEGDIKIKQEKQNLQKEKDELEVTIYKFLKDSNKDWKDLSTKKKALNSRENKVKKDETEFLERKERQETAFLEVEMDIKRDRAVVTQQLKKLSTWEVELKAKEKELVRKLNGVENSTTQLKEEKLRIDAERKKIKNQLREKRWQDG